MACHGFAADPTLTGIKDIALSHGFGCAIAGDSSVRCWGQVFNSPTNSVTSIDVGRIRHAEVFGREGEGFFESCVMG